MIVINRKRQPLPKKILFYGEKSNETMMGMLFNGGPTFAERFGRAKNKTIVCNVAFISYPQ